MLELNPVIQMQVTIKEDPIIGIEFEGINNIQI